MQLPTLTCPNVLTPPYFDGHFFCSQHILARWNTSRSLLSRHYHRCCHWNKHVVGKIHDCKQPTFNPDGTPGDSSPEWDLQCNLRNSKRKSKASQVPFLRPSAQCSFSGLPRDCSRSPSFAGGCHTWEEHLGRSGVYSWDGTRPDRQVCDIDKSVMLHDISWYDMHAGMLTYIQTEQALHTDRQTDTYACIIYLPTYLPTHPPIPTYLHTCAPTYLLVPTYLYLPTCTYLLVPTYLYLPTGTYLLVPTYLYPPTCIYLLALTYLYLPTGTYLLTCTYLPPSLPTYLILPT